MPYVHLFKMVIGVLVLHTIGCTKHCHVYIVKMTGSPLALQDNLFFAKVKKMVSRTRRHILILRPQYLKTRLLEVDHYFMRN